MRPYRAYDKQEKFWLNPEHFYITGEGRAFTCQPSKHRITTTYRLMGTERYAVEQAIGLQDKAGTESYAGDICSDGSKKYEVRWNSSAARFYLIGSVICKDIRMIAKMETIGDIHHHPALLEGGKK